MSRAEAIAGRNGIAGIAVRFQPTMKTRKRNRRSGRKAAKTETDRDERSRGSRAPAARLGNQAAGELLRAAEGREAADDRGRLDREFARAIQRRRGRGRPLPDGVRREAESAFDADFSDVRVHADERSDELARTLRAEAFTVGADVFFSEGASDQIGRNGRELLGHELAHTVQQRRASGTPSRVSDPNGDAEREATEAGRTFASGTFDGTGPAAERSSTGRFATRDRPSPGTTSRRPSDNFNRAAYRQGARSSVHARRVQRADDESIPTELPRIEGGPPEFAAEDYSTKRLIEKYHAIEDRILKMWADALKAFKGLAESPAGEVQNPNFTGVVLEFAGDQVLGRLSKPAKAMKDLLDAAADEAARARDVNRQQSIKEFYVTHHTAINALRQKLDNEADWKQYMENLQELAFGDTDVEPERGEIWVFGGDEDFTEEIGDREFTPEEAFEEFWALRTEFEALYVDAERRAQRASHSRFYRFLVEEWLEHNQTRVWPGVRREAQLFIHVDDDFTVREADLSAPLGAQIGRGFEVLAEAIDEDDEFLAPGVDVWGMNIKKRIFYYGRDPDDLHGHRPSHVIVIRRSGRVSEGESWGPDWESILERLRRDRPRVRNFTGTEE